MLVEEGKIGIENPVSRLTPSFAKTTVLPAGPPGEAAVPARRPIAIRDLLTDSSGYSYGTESRVAVASEAKGLPAVSHPGEAYVYGCNTDLLGCVVEHASQAAPAAGALSGPAAAPR